MATSDGLNLTSEAYSYFHTVLADAEIHTAFRAQIRLTVMPQVEITAEVRQALAEKTGAQVIGTDSSVLSGMSHAVLLLTLDGADPGIQVQSIAQGALEVFDATNKTIE